MEDCELQNLHNFICGRIDELVRSNHSSYKKLSIALGRSDSFIQKIMSSPTVPKLSVIFEICDLYKVRPCDFFNEDMTHLVETTNAIELMKNLSAERVDKLCAIMEDMQEDA